jgi:hypothetical protein
VPNPVPLSLFFSLSVRFLLTCSFATLLTVRQMAAYKHCKHLRLQLSTVRTLFSLLLC